MFSIAKQRNLLHWFKHKSIGAEKINKYLELFPETNRNVGTLPYDWLKDFPPERRAKITELVQDTFSSFVKETKTVEGCNKVSGYSIVDPLQFEIPQKKLVKLLKSILKRDDIIIRHAGSGGLKNCHRLDVGGYSYALSGFRAENACKKGFEDYFTKGQGRGYEPQNAISAYKRGAHGRFAKAFTAKIAGQQDEAGYILSKFIDKQGKSPIGRFQESRANFLNFDKNHDVINNINTDVGGCVANFRHIKNKRIKFLWNNFARALDANSEKLKNPSARKVQDDLLKLKHNGVDIFAPDFVNSLPYDAERKDIAVKLLKSLKNIRKQKESLTKNGEFEQIKKLLEEDIGFIYTDKKNNENFKKFIAKFESYPQLLAEEAGISNMTFLENWANVFKKYGTVTKIDLKSRFTKKEIVNLLDKNYTDYRNNDNLINEFKKHFKIEKELERFENRYLQSDIGKTEHSWDDFMAFMNRNK